MLILTVLIGIQFMVIQIVLVQTIPVIILTLIHIHQIGKIVIQVFQLNRQII